MNKIDRIVKKTKESIRRVFNELILKKDFTSITVSEIANLAEIDRKTFYLHYNSMADILNEFESELTDKVSDIIKTDEFIDIEKFLCGLNNIMLENIEVYRKIANQTTYVFLLKDCKNILKNSIIESFYEKSNMSIDIFKIYAEFIASGIISIYTDWLNSNSKMTLEELTVVAKDAVLCGWQKIIA
ncbi:TetR/AcrR family transcriptional regulator [uncultured Clostridium sp.]|uniref:TetR/AcrR family transcriptional regulator n=1 Tax=uncultured Clostridium sp. TaxID=59620 RepID=UPI0025DCC333|nr:TetR/AcrR family transcriptional regulator [uncultured Clostridium sp.]